ncbi:hypothetical protein RS3R2_26640 [Pseudomonas lactis]|nr:hypothetical protein RS3R2_26640 [Pseudomonas lactis]
MQNRKVPTFKKVSAYKLLGNRDSACERFEDEPDKKGGLEIYGGPRIVFRCRGCLKSYRSGLKVERTNRSSSSLFKGFDK